MNPTEIQKAYQKAEAARQAADQRMRDLREAYRRHPDSPRFRVTCTEGHSQVYTEPVNGDRYSLGSLRCGGSEKNTGMCGPDWMPCEARVQITKL